MCVWRYPFSSGFYRFYGNSQYDRILSAMATEYTGSDPTASSREDSNDNLQVIKTTIAKYVAANNYENVIQYYFFWN